MIVTSDNTATILMIDALGGTGALNQRFSGPWGLEATVLRNPLPDLDGTILQHPRPGVIDGPGRPRGGLLSSRSRDTLPVPHVQPIMQRHGQSPRLILPLGITIDDFFTLANKTGNLDEVPGGMLPLVDVPNGQDGYVVLGFWGSNGLNNDGRAERTDSPALPKPAMPEFRSNPLLRWEV